MREPLFRVGLPGEIRSEHDEWWRCPWKAIDPGAWHFVEMYWEARAEGVPLLPPPIDRWPCNTLTLSRIMRQVEHQAREQTEDGWSPTQSGDQAMAAAEAARVALEARLKGKAARGV